MKVKDLQNVEVLGIEPGSKVWNYYIDYTKPDWYSLFENGDGTKSFYRGTFPTTHRIQILGVKL